MVIILKRTDLFINLSFIILMGIHKHTTRSKKILGSYPYFTVMFSITMAIFVIGLFGLILTHAQKLSFVVKENIELNVFLSDDISDSTKNNIQNLISVRSYVLQKENKPQIIYISKDDAKKKFIETYGEDFSKVLDDNPLYASFTVKIKPEYSDSLNMRKISDQLTQIGGVKEVYYQEALINKINKNIRSVSLILAAFAVILILASVLLINNTIKLALYSQRFLIRSMQLVGATKWFIQKPFLWRALLQGIISALIATSLLMGLLHVAYSEVRELAELRENEKIMMIFGGLILVGASIGFLSSFRAVNKYLTMSLDELY